MPKGICMNLFGTFWARDTSWTDKYVINHERIHTAQQREMLFVGFYLAYIIEWVFNLLKYRCWNKAYMSISFEKEAYLHGKDLNYLNARKHFIQYRKEG